MHTRLENRCSFYKAKKLVFAQSVAECDKC